MTKEEERQQELQDYHNKGEQSAAAGNSHSNPHGVISLDVAAVLRGQTAHDQLVEENDAFRAGWDNTHKQTRDIVSEFLNL